jgi:hypothetical protein
MPDVAISSPLVDVLVGRMGPVTGIRGHQPHDADKRVCETGVVMPMGKFSLRTRGLGKKKAIWHDC